MAATAGQQPAMADRQIQVAGEVRDGSSLLSSRPTTDFTHPFQEHETNLYSMLGVPEDSEHDQIKGAYKRLLLQYHPDKNKEAPVWVYQKITHARDVLLDPKRREAYDRGEIEQTRGERGSAADVTQYATGNKRPVSAVTPDPETTVAHVPAKAPRVTVAGAAATAGGGGNHAAAVPEWLLGMLDGSFNFPTEEVRRLSAEEQRDKVAKHLRWLSDLARKNHSMAQELKNYRQNYEDPVNPRGKSANLIQRLLDHLSANDSRLENTFDHEVRSHLQQLNLGVYVAFGPGNDIKSTDDEDIVAYIQKLKEENEELWRDKRNLEELQGKYKQVSEKYERLQRENNELQTNYAGLQYEHKRLEKEHNLFKTAPAQQMQVANGELSVVVQKLLDAGLLSKSQDGSYEFPYFFGAHYRRCLPVWVASQQPCQNYPINEFDIDGFVATLALPADLRKTLMTAMHKCVEFESATDVASSDKYAEECRSHIQLLSASPYLRSKLELDQFSPPVFLEKSKEFVLNSIRCLAVGLTHDWHILLEQQYLQNNKEEFWECLFQRLRQSQPNSTIYNCFDGEFSKSMQILLVALVVAQEQSQQILGLPTNLILSKEDHKFHIDGIGAWLKTVLVEQLHQTGDDRTSDFLQQRCPIQDLLETMLILEKKYELSKKDRESTDLCRHWWFRESVHVAMLSAPPREYNMEKIDKHRYFANVLQGAWERLSSLTGKSVCELQACSRQSSTLVSTAALAAPPLKNQCLTCNCEPENAEESRLYKELALHKQLLTVYEGNPRDQLKWRKKYPGQTDFGDQERATAPSIGLSETTARTGWPTQLGIAVYGSNEKNAMKSWISLKKSKNAGTCPMLCPDCWHAYAGPIMAAPAQLMLTTGDQQ